MSLRRDTCSIFRIPFAVGTKIAVSLCYFCANTCIPFAVGTSLPSKGHKPYPFAIFVGTLGYSVSLLLLEQVSLWRDTSRILLLAKSQLWDTPCRMLQSGKFSLLLRARKDKILCPFEGILVPTPFNFFFFYKKKKKTKYPLYPFYPLYLLYFLSFLYPFCCWKKYPLRRDTRSSFSYPFCEGTRASKLAHPCEGTRASKLAHPCEGTRASKLAHSCEETRASKLALPLQKLKKTINMEKI